MKGFIAMKMFLALMFMLQIEVGEIKSTLRETKVKMKKLVKKINPVQNLSDYTFKFVYIFVLLPLAKLAKTSYKFQYSKGFEVAWYRILSFT